ncbi:phospholipase A1 member A [Dendroctonus ponderosae]|uniref:phospholipase A1 member A n=1 Tax=Dendroctonus ponderosae TaxID=77166 RepID=UPI0020359438|nr:phospholipase A1 member A [Dendroctonus ponderosae]KAH1017512.1 hypothetical protein HUJ05_008140 [Dendroctonus ponderosae]
MWLTFFKLVKWRHFGFLFVLGTVIKHVNSQISVDADGLYQHQVRNKLQQTLTVGSCKFVINPQCPDPDVTFFMYSTSHPESPEQIFASTHVRGTNLHKTAFNSSKPSKVIIHGYNSNMFLSALTELRIAYLKTSDYNIFAVDWSPLNQSPCYPAAVWNARHVGTCTAQLVDRIRDMGAVDIHVIGFSLGAHITNFISLALLPYRLPRITGLDPALPGYLFASNDEKLDKSDAEFVDVYHTSAFMQGKAQESGHIDFYFNGGSVQPGCWQEESFLSCNHHRAPIYYAESINSLAGFWGYRCTSYFDYLRHNCPPNEIEVLLGERVNRFIQGTYMVITAAASPFAIGPYFTAKLLQKVHNYPSEDAAAPNGGPNLFELAFPIPTVPILNRFNQQIVNPSTMEEDELFKQVLMEKFPNNSLAQAQIIGNDFGILRVGNN